MNLPPIDTTTGADVVKLPVKKAEPPTGERMLQPVPYIGRCKHWNVTFEVDEDSGDCKCLGCSRVRSSPEFGCSAWEREPGTDDDADPELLPYAKRLG